MKIFIDAWLFFTLNSCPSAEIQNTVLLCTLNDYTLHLLPLESILLSN